MDIQKTIKKKQKSKSNSNSNIILPRSSINSTTCWFCNHEFDKDIRYTPNFYEPKIGWNCCKKDQCLKGLNESKTKHIRTPEQLKTIFKKYKLNEPFINGYDDLDKFKEKGDIVIKRRTGNIEDNWYLNNCALRDIDNYFYVIVSKGEMIKKCRLKDVIKYQLEYKK